MVQKPTVVLHTAEKHPETEKNHIGKTIDVKVYDSFDQLESMQLEWDGFVESICCEIFLTYDWCRLWWKYYGAGRQLRLFVFRQGGTLIGIIPMFFEKIWLGPVFIRAGKVVGTDFALSTIIPPIRKEFLQEVIQTLICRLVADYRWDVLHIGPIAGIYRDFGRLLEIFQKCIGQGYQVRNGNNNVQTYFMLADSWEKQMTGFSNKKRRIINQKYRALREVVGEENTPIVSRFASTQDVQQLFDGFYEMHQRHWQKLGKPGHFGDWPDSRQFHREVALEQLKHDRLRLLEVKAGTYILGYKYAYKFGDKYLELLDARSEVKELARASLGKIVFCEQLKKALQERVKHIDSMRCKYEHKMWMGGKLFLVNNIYIYSGKLWPSIRIRIFRSLSWLLHMCYYRIWVLKIAPKLPFKRPLWRIWIRSNMFA